MIDVLILTVVVAIGVLTLFGVVRWTITRFFPSLNSQRFNPPVIVWWFLLLILVLWLDRLRTILVNGDPANWGRDEYWDAFYLCFVSYCLGMYIYHWPKRPQTSSEVDADAEGGSGG